MPIALSCYILTHNNADTLGQTLASLEDMVDDMIVVDSGSTDATHDVAHRFGARFLHRPLDDFTAQRTFAVAQCRNNWILTLDSDEVLSPALLARLRILKASGFADGPAAPDAFAIRRDWYVLRTKVHCFYPSRCPDAPVRLFRKDKAFYIPGRHVHESLAGFTRAERLDEPILHYTCNEVGQMYGKINLYTTLAARDLRLKGRPSLMAVWLVPWLVWFRWYVLYRGWMDGILGLIHARYVFDTVYQKYLKARYDLASPMGDEP